MSLDSAAIGSAGSDPATGSAGTDSVVAGMAVTEYRPSGEWDRTVVALSSLGVSRRSWAVAGAALGQRHRCLAVDIPGHGDSKPASHFLTVPDLAESLTALLEAEGIRDAVLVGNSMGATICTELAASRPDLVSHLVHVGSAVWESERDRRAWLHSRSGLFCNPDGRPPEMTADFVEAIFGSYDAERHRMLREDQRASGVRLGWAMWALYSYDTVAALRKLGQPVLAVFGENDPYRAQTLPLLRRHVERLDEVALAGGGHLLPIHRGPELARHIDSWLCATPATGGMNDERTEETP
jgi:pimeloyl-ACP methyl ester carboxylesterase